MNAHDLLALTAVDIDDVIWPFLNADSYNHLNWALEQAFVYHGGADVR